MSLDVAGLKTNLKALFDATRDPAVDAADAEANFVNGLANAIQEFVLSATIIYTDGLVSATGGPVSGVFNGQLE